MEAERPQQPVECIDARLPVAALVRADHRLGDTRTGSELGLRDMGTPASSSQQVGGKVAGHADQYSESAIGS
jgi:hypothetical protein